MTLCAGAPVLDSEVSGQIANQTLDTSTESTNQEYISFGSYPQTEITDGDLIEAIESAIETATENVDTGTSVWVNDTRYSRLMIDNQPSYYKWEPIQWKVLENDGKTLFVVSDKVLDCRQYNETKQDVTWENSTLRSWLNGYDGSQNIENKDFSNQGFLQTAFSGEEQAVILQSTLDNQNSSQYQTPAGNNTADSVFLLSLSETANENYGFSDNIQASTADRQAAASDYAYAMGVEKTTASGMEEKCDWWLRSPGMCSYDGAYVNFSGYPNQVGLGVDYEGLGVRPALYISTGTEDDTDNGDQTDGNEQDEIVEQETEPVLVEKLTINAPSKKLAAGKKIKLTVTVAPENAENKGVTWKTSNKKYATIDKNGKLTLKKAGAGKTVTITATAKDGSGKKASIKIKIMKHGVKSVQIKAPAKTLKAGKSMKLKTTVKTTGTKVNKTLKWTSSNTKYATVSKSGKVTAKKAGKGKKVTITASSMDGSNKKAKVTIKIK